MADGCAVERRCGWRLVVGGRNKAGNSRERSGKCHGFRWGKLNRSVAADEQILQL